MIFSRYKLFEDGVGTAQCDAMRAQVSETLRDIDKHLKAKQEVRYFVFLGIGFNKEVLLSQRHCELCFRNLINWRKITLTQRKK